MQTVEWRNFFFELINRTSSIPLTKSEYTNFCKLERFAKFYEETTNEVLQGTDFYDVTFVRHNYRNIYRDIEQIRMESDLRRCIMELDEENMISFVESICRPSLDLNQSICFAFNFFGLQGPNVSQNSNRDVYRRWRVESSLRRYKNLIMSAVKKRMNDMKGVRIAVT